MVSPMMGRGRQWPAAVRAASRSTGSSVRGLGPVPGILMADASVRVYEAPLKEAEGGPEGSAPFCTLVDTGLSCVRCGAAHPTRI